MNNVLIICAVVILVFLFLKMPVFLSLLAGTVIYFLANSSTSM